MTPKKITAVLFDWDFTLAYTIDENISHSQRIFTLFQAHGVQCTRKQLEDAFQQLATDIESGRVQGSTYPQTKRQIIQNYRFILSRVAHPDTSSAFAYQLYAAYAELPHYLYAEVIEVLEALQAEGLKLGILSNHSCSARRVIENMVGRIIPPLHITISEEEGVHKPAKTAFRRAATRVGASPAQCAYVGDNLEVDAIGATQKGGYGLGVWLDRRQVGPPQSLPSRVAYATTLRQIPNFVQTCS